MELFSIIIPANNEADYIDRCLAAVMQQTPAAGPLQIIVVANACTDTTVAQARAFAPQAAARGWQLDVLDLEQGGKPGALNAGDAQATGPLRAYLDADIVCDLALFGALRAALSATDAPLYATGKLRVVRAKSPVTRAYAAFWQSLPFVQSGAVGTGLYAVNAAGRARWNAFPAIITDDTFVRLNFAPQDRIEVAPPYDWPMIEGFAPLVKVRRRQDAGVHELAALFPDLMANAGKAPLGMSGLLSRAAQRPWGFVVYAAVSVMVRLKRSGNGWTRGR